jgi:MerR family transcriptional regulator, copper efflux regulator
VNIQEAGERSGLNPDTIRFYERKGVLPRPPRRENGYRDYTEEHIPTLVLARGLRDLGIPTTEMSLLTQVAHDGDCGDLRSTLDQVLANSLQEIRERIEQLTNTERRLEAILRGLKRMSAGQRTVPGATPCSCVALVDADGSNS